MKTKFKNYFERKKKTHLNLKKNRNKRLSNALQRMVDVGKKSSSEYI